MAHRKSSLPALAGVLFATLALPAVAANIYKYVDEDGRTVFNSYIPAEYVRFGYTVLNEQGLVVEVVPRAATPEELAARLAKQQADAEALAARVAQEEYDKLLLRLYRAPEEIERKRDYTLDQMKTQQDLTRMGLNKAGEQVARAQGVIDTAKKEGREPTADAVKKLEVATAEQALLQNQVNKMELDKVKLIADASRDIIRLRELMRLPPLPVELTLPKPASAEGAETPPAEKAEAASAEQPAAQ